MTPRLLFAIAAITCFGVPVFAQQRTEFTKLPKPVQETVNELGERDAVKKATRHDVSVGSYYDIELERKDAPNPHLRISDSGTLLTDTRQPDTRGDRSVNPGSLIDPNAPVTPDTSRNDAGAGKKK